MNQLSQLSVFLFRAFTILAVVLSYTKNHSIGWAWLHGCVGPFYVAYATSGDLVAVAFCVVWVLLFAIGVGIEAQK